MRKYDYVLFDLDGTLFDTAPGVKNSLRHCFDTFGLPYTEEILHKMIGPPFRVSLKEFFGIDPDNTEKFISVYRDYYEKRGIFDLKPFDGVENLLQSLKTDGFKLGVATSKPIFFTDKILERTGFVKYFDYVGGAVSDSARDTKSDVINYVIKGLGIVDKSRAAMVGDRLYDVEGARESGMDSIAILWGYGGREELTEHRADYIIDTPANVYDFLTDRH